MELQQLRYFMAAAETGNVTRAAARCRIAQPSLSQQLKKLEMDLGVTLFDRLGRGIALTDAGRAFLPRAKRILEEVRETEMHLRREAEEGPGSLNIGAIATMAPYLFPPAIKKLRAAYPETPIVLREDLTENLVQALLENEIDCAIVSTPIDQPLLQVEVIAEEELLVAVPKGHPDAGEAHWSFTHLRGQPTVTLEETHCLGRQIDGFCAARRVTPSVVCRMTQLTTILELVGMGLGISIVPEMAAAADRAGRCRYVRLRPGKPMRQIAVAYRQGRTLPLAARRMIEIVKENLGRKTHRLEEK